MKKFIRIISLFLVIISISSMFIPFAYAWTEGDGVGNGNGSSGGGGGGGTTTARWYIWRIRSSTWDPNHKCGFSWRLNSYTKPITYTFKVDASVELKGWPDFVDNPSFSVDNVVKSAVLLFTNFVDEQKHTYTGRMCWRTWYSAYKYNVLEYSGILSPGKLKQYYNFTTTYDSRQMTADPDIAAEVANNGYFWSSEHQWYWNGNTALYLVGIQRNETWDDFEEVSEETKKVIARVTGSGNSSDNFNHTAQSAEWLWNNGKISGHYYGKTGPSEYDHSKTVTATFYNIKKITTTTGRVSSEGNYSDVVTTVTYQKSAAGSASNTIRYNATPPVPKQIWFIPYNLNTQAPAEESLVKTYYPDFNSTTALDMAVNNHQGTTDGSALKMIDTNKPQVFGIQFNKKFWGMPNTNWYTTEPFTSDKKADGTYPVSVIDKVGVENSNYVTAKFYPSTNHAGQNVKSDLSNVFRWGGNMTGSHTGGDNATIQLFGSESNDISLPSNFKSTYFYMRAIKPMTFQLCNSEHTRPWWELTYQQGRFFEYGYEYEGKITTSEVKAATCVSKNFYVRMITGTYIQPILYGEMDVKTVGGSIG